MTSRFKQQQTLVKKPKSRKLWKLGVFLFLLFLVIAGFFLWRINTVYNKVFTDKETGFLKQLQNTAMGTLGMTSLVGENEGQVNILLLGIGGENHDGGYLTDSIILAQVRLKDKKVSLTHIPRDYYVYIKQARYSDKINTAFALGFQQNKDFGEAGEWATTAVESISGLNIPYFAVVDFSGFTKAIDAIGGIDINIERTFTDSTYPDDKLGLLAPLTFTAGPTHMDGKRALIFARSRHGNNNEGSDFARGVRQQKVLYAIKDKVTSANLLSNVSNLNKLLDVVADHSHTNLKPGEILHLFNLTKSYRQDNIISVSLDGTSGILCDGRVEETNAYILTLCEGQTEKDLRDFFHGTFNTAPSYTEKPRILVLTTGTTSSEYKKIVSNLKKYSLTHTYRSYKTLPSDENIFYVVNDKTETIKLLQKELGLYQVFTLPQDLKYDSTKTDIIILTRDISQ